MRPALIIGMETLEELRSGMVRQAGSKFGSHVLLLNHNGLGGNTPDWRRLEADWEYERILPLVKSAGVISEEAVAYLHKQGLPSERMERLPNIKFDVARHAALAAKPELERERLKILPCEQVVIFGSAYPEEHEILLQAYVKILDRRGLERTRLIIAPRYTRTTARILEMLSSLGLTGVRLTEIADASAPIRPVIVVDTAGDLRKLYSIADVALVAGSLKPNLRGHNPIEPAAFGTAVITGPYTSSFTEVMAKFIAREAILQLKRPEEAAEEIIRLLEDPRSRERLGQNALRVVEEASGAEDRYMEMIAALNL